MQDDANGPSFEASSPEVFELAQSCQRQLERVRAAARAVGRRPDEVTLIAVSKRQPVWKINAAYAAGQRDFGENYAQELVEKAKQLSNKSDIRWHMIGHLQTNKAKSLAPLIYQLHTVSSERLGRELDKRMAALPEPAQRRRLSVLVEVNVSGEESKNGCSPAALPALLDQLEQCAHLSLSGLMTVPPRTEDPAAARPHFQRLAELRDALGGCARLPHLSMGMSHDAEIAVACGATQVRIGSALFGPRSS